MSLLRKRCDWSRRLRRPLVILKVMTIATFADVRELMRHLPADRRRRSTWTHVAKEVKAAAQGAEPRDVEAALLLVLAIEHVPCRPD